MADSDRPYLYLLSTWQGHARFQEKNGWHGNQWKRTLHQLAEDITKHARVSLLLLHLSLTQVAYKPELIGKPQSKRKNSRTFFKFLKKNAPCSKETTTKKQKNAAGLSSSGPLQVRRRPFGRRTCERRVFGGGRFTSAKARRFTLAFQVVLDVLGVYFRWVPSSNGNFKVAKAQQEHGCCFCPCVV